VNEQELNTTQEELLEAVGYWFIIYIKTTVLSLLFWHSLSALTFGVSHNFSPTARC